MKHKFLSIAALIVVLASCSSSHEVANITRTRILIDNRYDANPDSAAQAFLAPYKQKVDSIMSPVVGSSARYMAAKKPESNLSNLLADILIWAGKNYNEKPVFGVYNMGGIRAALPEGEITYGNVLDVAPFENKICFLNLKGTDVIELFKQIAANRGEGVSRGVNLVITSNGELVSAKLNGKDIEPDATYRVASIDYLAEGNDRLTAFKNKTNLNSPQHESNNMRFIIMDYFRYEMAKGRAVDAKVEGRIVVKNEE